MFSLIEPSRTIENIPKEAVPHFRPLAKDVLALFKGDAEEAIAACMAQISGHTEFASRSLINQVCDARDCHAFSE